MSLLPIELEQNGSTSTRCDHNNNDGSRTEARLWDLVSVSQRLVGAIDVLVLDALGERKTGSGPGPAGISTEAPFPRPASTSLNSSFAASPPSSSTSPWRAEGDDCLVQAVKAMRELASHCFWLVRLCACAEMLLQTIPSHSAPTPTSSSATSDSMTATATEATPASSSQCTLGKCLRFDVTFSESASSCSGDGGGGGDGNAACDCMYQSGIRLSFQSETDSTQQKALSADAFARLAGINEYARQGDDYNDEDDEDTDDDDLENVSTISNKGRRMSDFFLYPLGSTDIPPHWLQVLRGMGSGSVSRDTAGLGAISTLANLPTKAVPSLLSSLQSATAPGMTAEGTARMAEAAATVSAVAAELGSEVWWVWSCPASDALTATFCVPPGTSAAQALR